MSTFKEQLNSTHAIINSMPEADRKEVHTTIAAVNELLSSHDDLAGEMALSILLCERLAEREAMATA